MSNNTEKTSILQSAEYSNKNDRFRDKKRPMSQVYLDALIPREDLEIEEQKIFAKQTSDIEISSLKKGAMFMESLRKPQFQRSTIEWTPEKVFNLVKSFTNGHLIPSIILWKGGGYNFVIDGAHRLSALIAWVNDDYGIGYLSQPFFTSTLEKGQREKAKETKKLIEEEIGAYKDIVHAYANKGTSDPKKFEIGERIASLSINLQWVPGNASQAEDSFFKINEAASPLDSTEKRLLKARNKPMAIAARAIIRAGSGHKYWGKFSEKSQSTIEETALEISDWLFKPQLSTPVKTMDIPLAGNSYAQATQELILNVVNFSNQIKIVDASRIKKAEKFPENDIEDDTSDGQETVKYLVNTRKMLANLTGKLSSSLGLHPAIYFYSHQGRYQVTAFMAILPLIKEYEEKNQVLKFTKIRRRFEEFLWKHKALVNQATPVWGSGAKGYTNMFKLFDFIIKLFLEGKDEPEIISALDSNELYKFYKPGVRELNPKYKSDMSTETKSEAFMRQGVEAALRCSICGGYLHINSIQVDHDKDISKGGIGNADNGKLVHPFCNGSKTKLKALGLSLYGHNQPPVISSSPSSPEAEA